MKCKNGKIKLCFTKTCFLGFFAVLIFSFSQTAWASEINSENVIKFVNESRYEAGLSKLIQNNELAKAAQDKAADMIANNYFAHTSPGGVNPWHWIDKYGYDYTRAGENLAMNFTQAENQEEAWMKSEKHRQNILNADYKEIGVAVKQGVIAGKMTTVTVQMFGARSAGAPSIPQENAVSQEPVKNFTPARNIKLDINQLDLKLNSPVSNIPLNQTAGIQFQYPQTVLYQNQETVSKFAWAVALLILLLVIAINSVSLSRMIKTHGPKASVMANTVILIIVLTAMIFERM